MTTFELEVAAYAAAHRIYNGLGQPDRACPGGYRSASIDKIAQAIKDAFSVHHRSALTESTPSPAVESVRHSEGVPNPGTRGHGWITGTADVDALDAGEVLRCSDCKIPVGGQHRPSCHRQGLVTPDSDYLAPGLLQTTYWRQIRHAFDLGGSPGTVAPRCESPSITRPCLKCGMLYPFDAHYTPSGVALQPVNVEPAASNEAAKSE